MSMIEFDDNLDLDEEFDVLHGILELPIKCLEEDEDVEDWDISNLECLGPVPSNVLTEIPMASDEKFNLQHPDLFPLPVTPITGALELMQLPKHVDTSGLHILPLRKFAKVQESPSFRTQSPVSVLERNGSHPREKSLSIKSDNVIPVRSRSKCVRYASINPWLLAAHGLSTSKQTPNANRSRKSRKILCQQSVATDLSKKFPRNVHSLDVSGPTHIHNISKKCSHCQSTKSPQWRWGPLGKNTLCNACGVRYRSGCLFPEYRPAASPTFSQSQHSSSHRKVTEMRNKANLLTAKLKVAPLSPKTEAKIEEPLIALQMEAKNLRPTSRQLEVQIVRAPVRKQLTKHVDTSSSLVHPRIIGTREQKQLVKHVDTSSSLFYPLIVRAPEQMKRPKHTDTTSSFIMPQKVEAPKKRRLVKHVDISWSPLSPKNAGAFKQKQLANDVDTSGSCISPQIIGAPKRKKLAKYDDTCSSYIPLQNKHASVQESGAFGDENQISLLESRVSCSRERSLSSMSSRLKHVKHTGTSSLLLVSSSTSKKTSNSSKGKESRNKKFQLPVATDALKDSPKNDENSLDFSGSARLQNASNHGHAHGKKCAHCQSTKTPQWREGPLGPRTLCNACGVRYRSGRLVPEYRPAASPTFVPSKHSNLHSEVVRMIKAEHTSLRPGVESKVPITYHHSQSLFHE